MKTTLNYVGVLDVTKRAAPSMYSFDWAELESLEVQERIIDGRQV